MKCFEVSMSFKNIMFLFYHFVKATSFNTKKQYIGRTVPYEIDCIDKATTSLFHFFFIINLGKLQFEVHIIIWMLSLVLLNNFNNIFHHLKLELLTQFPASND